MKTVNVVDVFWHEACRCWYWSADKGRSWYSSASREVP